MVPIVTRETAFRQKRPRVGFWYMDLVVQISAVKQPIERNSVGSGHVFHRRTSAFNNHLAYCFIVFKSVKQSAEVRRFCVCGDVIHIE